MRDADGVPQAEKRPAEAVLRGLPRVPRPVLVERARATAGRNVARDLGAPTAPLSRHPPLRLRGLRSLQAGHACQLPEGIPRYVCTLQPHPALRHSCQHCRGSPRRTDSDVVTDHHRRPEPSRRLPGVERRPATPDAEALAAALAAERSVAELEQQAAVLAKNLALVSGAAAQIVAEQLNALNDDLTAARVERDRLAAACRVTVAEDALALAPQDALAATILDAIQAMIAADADPAHTFPVLLHAPEGAVEYTAPLSWKAWQAALAVLNVTVTVAQANSGLPRWVAGCGCRPASP